MVRFSERIGISKSPITLQVESISDELKHSLWNLLIELYDGRSSTTAYWHQVAKHIAQYFRKVPVDELPYQEPACRTWLKNYFYSLNWYELYELIEFIVTNHMLMTRENVGYSESYYYHSVKQEKLIQMVNSILQRELSGYHFVSGILTPISNPTEVDEIEKAMATAKKKGLHGCQEHLSTALELIGKKPKPDYRNAIKEAISAVESIVKQISKSNAKGLKGALNELSKNTEIHNSLKSGFIKLYGYSSDEDGIRHAILEQPKIGFVEAKYMIVSCSAFINYLIEKASDAGLLK